MVMVFYEQVDAYLSESTELSEPAVKFLLDLLEHEAQHHGQLARYLYGLKVGLSLDQLKLIG